MELGKFKPVRPVSRYGSLLAKPLVSLALLALSGCQGMYLHQPDRAATASTAKKSVDLVDVQAITRTENDNLARMLKHEVSDIEARATLSSSLAVIQISTSEQSVADHYTTSLSRIKPLLGSASMLDIQGMASCQIERTRKRSALSSLGEQMGEYGTDAPACKPDMPPTVSPRDPLLVLNTADRADLTSIYSRYANECKTLQPCADAGWSGKLDAAKAAAEQRKKNALLLKQQIAEARTLYADALKQNTDATAKAADKEKTIREKAGKLADLVNKLAAASPTDANRLKADALVELLTSAASGQASTDTATATASLTAASEVAATLPSLAQSIADARAASRQVPVSHLLLALNNLLVTGERDDRLAALDAEELAALGRQAQNLEQQARLFRTYSDQLCNLAFAGDGRQPPRQACDTLVMTGDGDALQCTITLKDTSSVTINKCVLGKSWRTLFSQISLANLKTPARRVEGRRALYEAVAAYLQMRLIAQKATVEEFNVVDVGYRRSVVQTEAGLQQWKNLVALPAGELDGYYSGGIKPAEVADLLIKAVGFTAVAIGVAK